MILTQFSGFLVVYIKFPASLFNNLFRFHIRTVPGYLFLLVFDQFCLQIELISKKDRNDYPVQLGVGGVIVFDQFSYPIYGLVESIGAWTLGSSSIAESNKIISNKRRSNR